MNTSTARQTFRELVAAVAEKAKAKLPAAVNGRIESAVKLVLMHDVMPQADGSILVGSSSDPLQSYLLVGTACECQDFAHGQAPDGWCQHRIAAGIAKRVGELLPPEPTPVVPDQTTSRHCLHQCGFKPIVSHRLSALISTLGLHASETSFCRCVAWLLIKTTQSGTIDFIPHQRKGCFGEVWPDILEPWPDNDVEPRLRSPRWSLSPRPRPCPGTGKCQCAAHHRWARRPINAQRYR